MFWVQKSGKKLKFQICFPKFKKSAQIRYK